MRLREVTVRRHLAQCLLVITLMLPGLSLAMDLGTIGPVYPIQEPHLLEFIRQRLQEKERSGELKQLQEQARARGVNAVRHPVPVAGIKPTERARTFYYDPTFSLDRNVLDEKGNLLFAAGTRKNPLEIIALSKHLLFFDGRDKRQVTRARELVAFYNGRVKPILVAGSYLDLMKAWGTRVYYDQQGVLTRRFGINQVPAIVSQEGLRLRIDELVLQ
jgi:conjugal transfer pilus assembly protein TraW